MSSSPPTAKRKLQPGESDGAAEDISGWSGCAACPLRERGFCAVLLQEREGVLDLQRREHMVRARQHLYRAKDKARHIAIIREGIAFRYVVVPDGRRQILSFALPGDFLSTSFLARDTANFSVQALTPVRMCVFDKADLQRFIREEPNAIGAFFEMCVLEKERYEAQIVDLGRRNSDERIARFLIQFATHFGWTGEDGFSFAFPVRQQHMADLLGLTQVHVSRVVSKFRRAGLIELSGGLLQIVDANGLRTAAGVRNN